MSEPSEPVRFVLVPHTHWDREWYLPFEVFRERLVRMMDGLIALLDADPAFIHFHLDGQAAMIDDYLEARPEREADVRRLAGAGRISIGPWYTQMDEFLVSGESLVRNLEWGLRRAAELGGLAPSEPGRGVRDALGRPVAGYLPDQFGHAAQTPQILHRAGIGSAVVWRGVPSKVDRATFRWESPDGSAVVAEYLAFGYGMGGLLLRSDDAAGLAADLESSARLLGPLSAREGLLMMVGGDHEIPAAKLPALLRAVDAGPWRVKGEIGSVGGFLDAAPLRGDLPVWRGELRSAARAHLLPNVYSNRVHQKRERAGVEGMLERYAEPLAALVPGFAWPGEEFGRAWRLLLWNGAHDSVCGCGVDEVARAVDARHREARAIAEAIARAALQELAGRVAAAGTLRFNPSPFERDGVPGLGWTVTGLPREGALEPVALRPAGGWLSAGDVRFRLVDEADSGDLYDFCPAGDGRPSGPVRQSVGPDGAARVEFPGVSVTVRAWRAAGDEGVRLTGVVANRRPDHRLRLHVALPGPAAGSTALTPFALVDRPVASEGGGMESPSPVWPARGAALAGGVAALAEGVFAYEVIADGADGPELAVALLRATGVISRETLAVRPWPAGPREPAPEAQMLGETAFALGLWPGAKAAGLTEAWERFALPLATIEAPGGGSLPSSGSLLAVRGAEVSAIRRTGDRLEVRIWNAAAGPALAGVGAMTVPLGPAEISTVRPPEPTIEPGDFG